MCGLAGLVDWRARLDAEEARARLASASEAVLARGPDKATIAADEHVAVLHSRLALVGGDAGAQPLVSPDRRRWLVFVGEIYNWRALARRLRPRHELTSGSDGEVLLHGWEDEGPAFLARVDGMFAMVLRDLDRDEVILARDRLGVKPLFVAQRLGRAAFATDVASLYGLLEEPVRLSWRRALQGMGQPGRAPGPVWDEVEEVEPGTALVLRAGRPSREERWHRFEARPAKTTADAARARYAQSLAGSVSAQTPDGGLGLALSGGLDSSMLAALSPRPPLAFVLDNDSTRANGEVDAAGTVARHLGLELVSVRPRPAVVLATEYRLLVHACETPDVRAEHLLKNELYRAAAGRGVRVLLSGQGSDEFNGGYSGLATGGSPAERFARYLEETIGAGYRGEQLLAGGIRPDLAPFLDFDRLDFLDGVSRADPWEQELHRRLAMLRRYNLPLEDRLAARVGLENRVPFLGNDVVDLLWAVPASLRAELLAEKAILRHAAVGLLPPAIISRPKVPFFHGASSGSTFGALALVLFAGRRGRRLVDEARQSRAFARGPLSGRTFDALADAVRHNPAHPASEALAALVNLALLDARPASAIGAHALPARAVWLGAAPPVPSNGVSTAVA